MGTKLNVISLLLILLVLSSCDELRLMDENKNIPEAGWVYNQAQSFEVPVNDTSSQYRLFVNLRISGDYPYSNFFYILKQESPSRVERSFKGELELADEQGQWLGKGLGDLVDYQLPVKGILKFPETGVYQFKLFQNMRTDTLAHVLSSGIRIEKIQP